jgi:predicted DCC family thiol-disulfide oxidoreductase YuxK
MTPERPTIVYDGQCRFCLGQIERIRRRDRGGVFEFLPRQSPELEQRFPQLAGDDFNTGLRLVDQGGKVHVGADGVYEIARRVPLWRSAAWLYRVPGLRQIFRGMYGLMAKNRYRLAGRCEEGDACRIDE